MFAAIAANPACSLASCNLEYAFAISQNQLGGDGATYRIMSDLMVEAKSLTKTAVRSEGGHRTLLVERTEEFKASADGGTPLEFDEHARRLSWTRLQKTWSKQSGFEFVKNVGSKRVKELLVREGLLSPHLEMPTAAGEALGISREQGQGKYGPYSYVAYGPRAAKHLLELVITEGLGAETVPKAA